MDQRQKQIQHARQHGLYDPRFETGSCGVGFIADVKGRKSRRIIDQALSVLCNLLHRGATGADPKTGDGAGILMQIPDTFLRAECRKIGIELPPCGEYAVGMIFLSIIPAKRRHCEGLIEITIENEGLEVLGWRDVPWDNATLGDHARDTQPRIRQIFVSRGAFDGDQEALERKLYIIRRSIKHQIRTSDLGDFTHFHIPSLSSRTIAYKGLFLAPQLTEFYLDLRDPAMETALAIVHQRYSTNTFPTWDLAHPFHYLAHNGEINTIRGNIAWMSAREAAMSSELMGDDLKKVFPIVTPNVSDSAAFDNVLEFLVMTGRSMAHAMMMMVPEAWEKNREMSDERRAFYEYHACLMEPWDGPAAMAFTDGTRIGGTLDRNGLRPARYVVTKDGLVVLASEVGVLDIPADQILRKGRLQPGKMFLIDTEQGRIIEDEEIKAQICLRRPYREWLDRYLVTLEQIERPKTPLSMRDPETLVKRQQVFGFTREDLRLLLPPMVATAQEPIGSMGNDTPLAVLSERPKSLFAYFKQQFAQVTNPPIDPLREEMVMSLSQYIGREGNLLDEKPLRARVLKLVSPVLTNHDLSKVRGLNIGSLRAATIPMLFEVEKGADGLVVALDKACRLAELRIEQGYGLLILSDRGSSAELAPIPSLLAVSAVHQYLVRVGARTKAGLIVESGEPREVMHFALLLGFGASAVNPYLTFNTIVDLIGRGQIEAEIEPDKGIENFRKAVEKGLLKIFSKMGISTLQSYQGAMIFEAVGLSQPLIERYFSGTPSSIGGIDLAVVAEEARMRHARAFPERMTSFADLDLGGEYQFRPQGEKHAINPDMIALLQQAVRTNNETLYRKYAKLVNDQQRDFMSLRGLFSFKKRETIPLAEVEPVEAILKRFCTGAMSFGSISKEAHETLAAAMNRIGGMSNTGEGGEDPARYAPQPNGDSLSSAIKQVASGRFGVTTEYLVQARELQIKVAQGAKPGEGGQLPGHKVNEVIARVRHSIPGVTLISPPPHHDIYSIEDLAQLIFDLKNVNPAARISVKLVSERGVGLVAAGVAKAKADVVLISGYEGGTGASPLSSVKHAGVPWEIGLAETQQILVLNGLRSRIRVQTDGQLKTGRDVVMAALLGAEEFGFSTVPLVTMGCVMMRKCHLNTCPTGIATQRAELRKRFIGEPEHVVNYFSFVAQEVRELMASIGVRSMDELVGRVELLDVERAVGHWKARGLDFSRILYRPVVPRRISIRSTEPQKHAIDTVLDRHLIELCRPALEEGLSVEHELLVRNTDRTVGGMLSGELTRIWGANGLPDRTIRIHFSGTAGQSFGAFLVNGVQFILEGDANDYLGKGLCGGRIIVFPPRNSQFEAAENIIVGNTLLYGATAGEVFISGVAGERFAVRNSGATAVVEGVGDHGCEYMTGGTVVVLGPTGKNFGAGMSGGYAFVYDIDGRFERRVNPDMVDVAPLRDSDDVQLLRTLIERHEKLTQSVRARQILATFERAVSMFRMVVPHEMLRIEAQRQKVVHG
ncbi:MAG: glutamate synthase large subunit [Myxococcales bacterium]|nr:glutamate synthase large subunit [Myxococcales bacterium]